MAEKKQFKARKYEAQFPILGDTIQIFPTKEQEAFLFQCAGIARYAYNWALTTWKEEYEAGNKPSRVKIDKLWTKHKPEWAYEVPSCIPQEAIRNLDTAFKNFFRRLKSNPGSAPGYPKYKSKFKSRTSFGMTNTRAKFDGRRYKIGKHCIKARGEGRWEGKLCRTTVYRHGTKWYVSRNVEAMNFVPKAHGDAVLGIDLGVKTAVVFSDGTTFELPRAIVDLDARIDRFQRLIRNKQKPDRRKGQKASNRWLKAKDKLARLHARAADLRKNFLHQVSALAISRASAIVIEDLNVSGMVKNHRLARAIQRVGFYELRRQLEYKGKLYGVDVHVADRFFPSSKTCNNCGCVRETLSLSERTFVCPDCGHIDDRDLNAAKNLRDLYNAKAATAT